MTGATPPIWQTLVDAGLAAGPHRPAVRRQLRSGRDRRRGHLQRQGLRRSTSAASASAACTSTRTCSRRTTWPSRPRGTSWSPPARPSRPRTCPASPPGGQDGWPIFVTGYGIVGNAFPDAAAYVQGLWDGTIKYNDEADLAMWEQLRILAQQMIEPGATGIAADGAPGRFAAGDVGDALRVHVAGARPSRPRSPPSSGSTSRSRRSDDAGPERPGLRQVRPGLGDQRQQPQQGRRAGLPRGVLGPRQLPGVRDGGGRHPDPADGDARHAAGPADRALPRPTSRSATSWSGSRPRARASSPSPCASFFTPFGTFETAQEAADAAQADLQAGLDANQ